MARLLCQSGAAVRPSDAGPDRRPDAPGRPQPPGDRASDLGRAPGPALAEWYRQQGATPDDALIIQVLDVDTRRYAVSLLPQAARDEAAIGARNQMLADAWGHLGNRRFDEDRLAEALALYERGQAAAETRTIGDPARYPSSFWADLDSRPFMRALHGRGLCLWRLGRLAEAREILAQMLALNPNDNQGARFLLADLEAGLSWQDSLARSGEQN